MLCNSSRKSYCIRICGIVQGVGYRPYIYQRAAAYNIKGWVTNAGGSLVIAAEGNKENLKLFIYDVI